MSGFPYYRRSTSRSQALLRARVPGQIHTRPSERERLIKFGKAIGRAVEELITIVKPSTFYQWLRKEGSTSRMKNPKGGQRKPRDIRERVIQTIKHECLANFIIFGKRHLDHLLTEFTDYYNSVRSHMERNHLPPCGEIPDEVVTLKLDQVEIRSHVGGLVKSFHKKAA